MYNLNSLNSYESFIPAFNANNTTLQMYYKCLKRIKCLDEIFSFNRISKEFDSCEIYIITPAPCLFVSIFLDVPKEFARIVEIKCFVSSIVIN